MKLSLSKKELDFLVKNKKLSSKKFDFEICVEDEQSEKEDDLDEDDEYKQFLTRNGVKPLGSKDTKATKRPI
jgi:hypothetical protein